MKYTLLLAVLLLASCGRRAETAVERISNQDYEVLAHDLETQFPGSIHYYEHTLFWDDAFSFQSFIHAVDAEDGHEMMVFGNRGDGPAEFTAACFSSGRDAFYVQDGNKGFGYRVQVQSDSLLIEESSIQPLPMATRILRDREDCCILFCPSEEKPFLMDCNGNREGFGKLPPSEGEDAFSLYQGEVHLNPGKSILAYAPFRYPYLALYRYDAKGLSVVKEMTEDETDDSRPFSVHDMCLTRDYVVLVKRDVKTEGEVPAARMPRDPATLPRSFYVYDYGLNLKRIITLPFPTVRICGDTESNHVYGIGLDEDYFIYSTEL